MASALACTGSDDGVGDLAFALDGRTFVSERVEGWTLAGGEQIRIGFHDHALHAFAGCNSLGGAFKLIDGKLELPSVTQSAIGCEVEWAEQDRWLSAFLRARPSIVLDEPRLEMATTEAKLVLLDREIASPDRPLVGTTWTGEGFTDGDLWTGTSSDSVTLRFDATGIATIGTGCDTGSVRFSVIGTQISLKHLAYDGVDCTQPHLERIHAGVVLVLDGSPVTFDIEERLLRIRRGPYTLRYRSAE